MNLPHNHERRRIGAFHLVGGGRQWTDHLLRSLFVPTHIQNPFRLKPFTGSPLLDLAQAFGENFSIALEGL
jgi:hypothetical protein